MRGARGRGVVRADDLRGEKNTKQLSRSPSSIWPYEACVLGTCVRTSGGGKDPSSYGRCTSRCAEAVSAVVIRACGPHEHPREKLENRSAKPDVLHSCAKSPAQTRTLANRNSTCMCHEMCHELFHPKRNSVSVVMPLIKVDDDTERKRQRRAASPSERGRRSERAPWSKARDANRKR